MGITLASSLLWAVAFIVITKGAESSRRQHTTGGYYERKPFIFEANLPYPHRRRSESKNFRYTKRDSWTPDRNKVTPEYRRRVLLGRNEDHYKSRRHEVPSGNLGRLITNLDSAYEAFGGPTRHRQKYFAKDKVALHQALLNYNNRPHKRRRSFSTGENRIKWHHDRYGVQDELRSLLQLYNTKYPESQKYRTDYWYPRDINKWLDPEHDIHKQFSPSSHLRTLNLRSGVFKQTRPKQWEESEPTIKIKHHDGATTLHRSPYPDREEKVIWERINSKPILRQSERHPTNDNNKKWQLWDGHGKSLQYADEILEGRNRWHVGSREQVMENYKNPLIPDDNEMKRSHDSGIFNPIHHSNREVPPDKKLSYADNGFKSEMNTNYPRYGEISKLMLPSHREGHFERLEDPEAYNENKVPIHMRTLDNDNIGSHKIDSPHIDKEQTFQEYQPAPVVEEVSAETEDNFSNDENSVQGSNEKGNTEYITTNTQLTDTIDNAVSADERHEHPTREKKQIPVREELTAESQDDVDYIEKAVQASNEKGNTDYATTNTPQSEEMINQARQKITAHIEDDVNNEEKAVQDSIQKANTDYATTNTPATGGMHNQVHDDWRHDQTITEHEPQPVREELTAQPEYDVDSEEKSVLDSNEKVNTDYATTNTPQSDGMDNPATDDWRHEQTYSEYKTILEVEDIIDQTEDDVNNKEKVEQDSNQKGNTDYATTNTLATDGMYNVATDDGRHYQSVQEYKPLPVEEELTVQSGDVVNNEQKAVQDSNEKGGIEYATINTPVSDRIATPLSTDRTHEQTTTEYKPFPVGEEVTAKSVDHVSDDEKAVLDSNETGNTKYATTNTPLSDGMGNPATDGGKKVQTTTEHKSMPAGKEGTAETVEEFIKDAKAAPDSNAKGNTEYSTSNTAVTDTIDKPVLYDDRNEQSTTENESTPVEKEGTADAMKDISNEERSEHDSYQTGKTEDATINTPISDGMNNPATNDGRNEQTTTEHKSVPAGKEGTAEVVGDLSNQEKTVQDANKKENTENTTSNTPLTDTLDYSALDDKRHEQPTKEHKQVSVGEEVTAQSMDLLSNKEKAGKDSDEKGNTEYATTHNPVRDGMDNAATNNVRHEETTIEYKAVPDGEELTSEHVDDGNIEEKVEHDPVQKGNIE